MTFFDTMAALATKFAAGDMFTDAALNRAASTFDPVAGSGTISNVATIACRAVLTIDKIRDENGVVTEHTSAIINTEPLIGDTLTIGQDYLTVTSITRIAPDGIAILWKVGVMR